MKILVTSRDVGAAKQNLAFVENTESLGLPLEFKIIAEQPGSDIFKNSGYDFIEISESSKDEYFEIVNVYEPDFVLLGLSGFRAGIDESIREICAQLKIPCGVIQDYWGYIGVFEAELLPDNFFVIDHQASQLTSLNTGGKSNCIVTGSPKHEKYGSLVGEWSSAKPFTVTDKPILLLVGQPYEMPGYEENINAFFSALEEVDKSLFLYIKDHPNNKYNEYSKWLEKYSFPYIIMDRNISIEPCLYNADLVISCCSTAGLDHSYMQFYSEEKIGELLYLSIGIDIKDFFTRSVGPMTLEELINGMGKVAYSKEEIKANIIKLLDYNNQNYRTQTVMNLSNELESPTATIYEYINREVLGRK